MDILDQLTTLRTHTPGCTLVAFSDLSSGVVLCASSAVKQRQERLDSICAVAAELLDGEAARIASDVLASDESSTIDEAVTLNAANSRIFIRSGQEKNDALCCVCSANMDINGFIGQARVTLQEIATNQ